MIACVAGMHRSGTSLLAQMLHRAGVWLGPADKLMAPSPENPDGYWEHIDFVGLNEELLGDLGGGWDSLPDAPDWTGPALDDLRERARLLVKEFADETHWGWKDPRNCVTLPFWLDIVPDAKVVACVRNPLDVSLSLQRRGGMSYRLSLDLWFTYYRRLLEDAPADRLVLVHYDNLMADPEAELRRVLTFLGTDVDPSRFADAVAAVKVGHRHHDTPTAQLITAGVAAEIIDLYLRLSDAAGYRPAPADAVLAASGNVIEELDTERPLVDLRVITAESNRRAVLELRAGLAYRDRQLEDLRNRLEAATLAPQSDAETISEVVRGELRELRLALFSSIYDLKQAIVPPESGPDGVYRLHLHRRVREAVRAHVPDDAPTLVISGGDAELLDLWGRPCGHFPQATTGVHAGHHPASDLAAIAHLEALRHRGASFLVIPAPSTYWLDHYAGFADHLAGYGRLFDDPATAVIIDLRVPVGTSADAQRALVEGVWVRIGRRPDVLDCTNGTVSLGAVAPMRSPVSRAPLPFVDASVDAVFVTAGDAAMLADAQRIATTLVAVLSDDGSVVAKHWSDATAPSITLATAWPGDEGALRRWLATIAETVPSDLDIEFIVATHARDAVSRWPGPAQAVDAGRDVAAGLRAAASAASGEVVVLLEPDSIPLPGWLPRVVEALGTDGTVAVGPRVIDAYGVMSEAGGEVFADATVSLVGSGMVDLDAAELAHVRAVDWCSTRLLALDAGELRAAGGVPSSHRTAAGAAVELCLALRARGGDVRYQPAAIVIDGRTGSYALPDLDDQARVRTERADLLRSSNAPTRG